MFELNEKDLELIEKLQNNAKNIYGTYELDKSLIWMTEEFGEVIQAIRKKKSRDEIAEEIGDLVAWVLCISNILNIKLADSITKTFEKEVNRQIETYGKLKYFQQTVNDLSQLCR